MSVASSKNEIFFFFFFFQVNQRKLPAGFYYVPLSSQILLDRFLSYLCMIKFLIIGWL